PLSQWLLSSSPSQGDIAVGLMGLLQALKFANANGIAINPCTDGSGVYVTPGGEFKLFCFYGTAKVPLDERFFRGTGIRAFKDWGADRAGATRTGAQGVDGTIAGELLERCYENVEGGMETCFRKALGKLKEGQMSPGKLLGAPVFAKGVCKVKKVDHLKVIGQEGKNGSTSDGIYYRNVVRAKVREVLGIYASPKDEGGRRVLLAGVETYYMTLKEGEWVEEDKVLTMKLFQVNDRAVRGALLGSIGQVVGGGPLVVNKIFEPLCSGFTDSSPALRELTLKSCAPL
ncbi:hypothetical protein TrRE_jg2235, partial [Triparma retinervis]